LLPSNTTVSVTVYTRAPRVSLKGACGPRLASLNVYDLTNFTTSHDLILSDDMSTAWGKEALFMIFVTLVTSV